MRLGRRNRLRGYWRHRDEFVVHGPQIGVVDDMGAVGKPHDERQVAQPIDPSRHAAGQLVHCRERVVRKNRPARPRRRQPALHVGRRFIDRQRRDRCGL